MQGVQVLMVGVVNTCDKAIATEVAAVVGNGAIAIGDLWHGFPTGTFKLSNK